MAGQSRKQEPVQRGPARQGTSQGHREQPAEQGRFARVRQWWTRAWGSAGHERHTLLLIGKSTLAATVAWVFSYNVLDAESPAFAPFSAVLIMQVTVYQSLLQLLRYVGAVATGVAVQAVLGYLAGPDLLTFALVAVVALTIGRWPALGSQGSQVATAAFFAFSTYVSAPAGIDKITHLGQIILLVLIGCGVGVIVNVALVPPLRYRSAEHGIHTLARALCDLVSDMYPAMREGEMEEERISHWRSRAEQTGGLINQAENGLRTARESLYYNPRNRLGRHRGRKGFEGYGTVLKALERTMYQMASLTRSLDQWRQDGAERDRRFLRGYADFLESISRITQVLGELTEESLSDQAGELCGLADRAQECCRKVTEQAEEDGLPLTDPAYPYGVLVVEATRLMDEFQYTCDVLQQQVDEA
ncbi:FUSC family protein [Streptomyces chrestomyceticus JCM 4735]|uniref:FUSC family protein n=1 Tax=Streptomyces chrestomyceticus JCM 4735 TaxID=1306181 RepID=A0A7U9KPA0_9ACTN|nr:aromatic acid exporter family protein [Streptomyces chrestomyceticus]GCD32869.1 FUSC family protein [Streptomyces chrestomyceticus JCM 4735]